MYETIWTGQCIRDHTISVADLGFPRGGGANSRGVPTYDFAKISPKLHEIERIWAPRGGAHPKFYYVDLPLHLLLLFKQMAGTPFTLADLQHTNMLQKGKIIAFS